MWITILTPLYNGIEFLEETLESVLKQTDPEWTMIVGVNGHGETGGDVATKAQELCKKDEKERITVVVQPPEINNKVKSINHLVKNHVNTEWVTVLDADDLWLPTKLEEQKKKTHEDYGILGTMGEYFGNRTGRIPVKEGEITKKDILRCNHIINCSAILRTKYANYSEEEGLLIDDYTLWVRLIVKENVRAFNISSSLCKHRLHSASFFNTQNLTKQVDSLLYKYRSLYRSSK